MRDEKAGWPRRDVLRGLAALSVSGALGARGVAQPRLASAQGTLADLGPEEKIETTMARLFGGRPIREDENVVKLDLPLIAENGAVVSIAVEVVSPMTTALPGTAPVSAMACSTIDGCGFEG